jgi:hypothetical protein
MSAPQRADTGAVQSDPFLDLARFVRYDSAGVDVVESLDSLWRGNGWWIDTTQVLLSVGVALGDTIYELHGVSLAVRLSGGGIGVYETGERGASPSLKVFDAGGRFRRRLGRRTPGPGELRSVRTMTAMPGDSLFVYDPLLARATVFAPNGTAVRTSSVPSVAGNTFAQLFPASEESMIGSLLLPYPLLSGAAGGLGALASTETLDSIAIVRVDDVFGVPARLLTLPRSHGVSANLAAAGEVGIPSAAWAPFGDRFFAGASDRVEIGEYDVNGFQHRAIKLTILESTLESYLLNPQLTHILPDNIGNLWLGVSGSADMLVVDTHGRLLGTVVIPPNRRVQAIGDDWVLMHRSDRLGVEYVEVLRIVKNEGG